VDSLSGNNRLRKHCSVDSGWPVDVLSRVQLAKHRTLAASVHGDVLPTGQGKQTMGIFGDQRLWHVASDRYDRLNLQLV